MRQRDAPRVGLVPHCAGHLQLAALMHPLCLFAAAAAATAAAAAATAKRARPGCSRSSGGARVAAGSVNCELDKGTVVNVFLMFVIYVCGVFGVVGRVVAGVQVVGKGDGLGELRVWLG